MTNNHISDGVVHETPQDLRQELLINERAAALWEDLTPLARNEWICWVISVKKPETRREHVQRVRDDLLGGKRRPCCWYGCIHRKDKALSPSVRGLLQRRKT